MKTKIHATAIVDAKAEIDGDVEIGPYCVVGRKVRIGRGTRLISHITVEGESDIGEQCTIYPFTSIGHAPQDMKYRDEDTRLRIGRGNTIREYVTIHRGSVGGAGETVVGNANFMMAYVHIAHDCTIGDHVIMANAATLAGHVLVEDHAVIGGLVAIHQYTRIGRYAMVGGFSGIGQDIPPYMIASGARAKLFGPNTIGLKRHGFSDEAINAIKKAYRILFREKRTLKDALKKVKDDFPDAREVQHLAAFIEKNKRGICR